MIDPIALPTVGRIVLLHDVDHIDAFPAIVVAVGPGKLTIAYLHVFLHDGARALEDVKHASEAHGGEPYWDWMPYQKGQAAKTEALQAALDQQKEYMKPGSGQRGLDKSEPRAGTALEDRALDGSLKQS